MVSIDHLLSSDEKAKLVSKLNMLSEMKAVPGGPPAPLHPSKRVVCSAVMHGLTRHFCMSSDDIKQPSHMLLYHEHPFSVLHGEFPSGMTQRENTRNAARVPKWFYLDVWNIHKNCPLTITIAITSTLFSTFTKL